MGSICRFLTLLAAGLSLNVFPLPFEPVANSEQITARLTETASWVDDGTACTQYEITVANNGSETVTDWTLTLNAPPAATISQFWNCTPARIGTLLCLTPADYARTISPGGQTQGIGLIAAGGKLSINKLTVSPTQVYSPPTPESVPPSGPIQKLHVSGTGIANEAGTPVQLRGVSTHGIAWYPQYINAETFQTLRDDWGANTIRLALYTAESGGYCSGGDQAALKAQVDKGVQAASELGMYVIIDWHILSDGDPRAHQSDAVMFFSELSAKYKDYPNVLYEICNEPNGAPWETAIKPYAQAVLAAIRSNAPDALVIVGTNTWSQDVDEVIGSRLNDPNVLYAFHFYAATHKDDLRQKLTRTLDAGVPILVSECGISEASGQGRVDVQSASAWLELLNQRNVGFVAWGLSNKAETVSLLQPGCEKVSGWSGADLTESGQWFRNAIRNRQVK